MGMTLTRTNSRFSMEGQGRGQVTIFRKNFAFESLSGLKENKLLLGQFDNKGDNNYYAYLAV